MAGRTRDGTAAKVMKETPVVADQLLWRLVVVVELLR
jgi:hypothetical protein